jgi:hypothetical protein
MLYENYIMQSEVIMSRNVFIEIYNIYECSIERNTSAD